MSSPLQWTVLVVALLLAADPALAFAPPLLANAAKRSTATTSRDGLILAATSSGELFQRSLLEARFKYQGKTTVRSGAKKGGISSGPNFAFQRALLGESLKQQKAAAAGASAEKASKEAAAAKKAAEETAAAEKAEETAAAAKAAEEAEAAKKAAEVAAAAKKAEEEAKALEEIRLKAAEEVRLKLEEEATLAAKKAVEAAKRKAEEDAKKKAEEEARLAVVQAEEEAKAAERAKEEAAAKKAKEEVEAKAEAEFAALVSRTEELKERVNGFGSRVKSIDFSKILPSADDFENAGSALTKFVANPREAANSLKAREESNPQLIKVAAVGAANVLVDGVGAGFELVDAIRTDKELTSVVEEALGNAGTAITAIVKAEDDNVERKLKIAILALDSIGMAAYASICGLVGYSQSGTPVSEAASKAAQGFLQAISALASLTVRSFDLAMETYKQGEEIAERAAQENQNDNKAKEEKVVKQATENKPAVAAVDKPEQATETKPEAEAAAEKS